MIEPSHALAELVRQHATLRDMMDDCEQMADEIDRGRGDVTSLVQAVTELRGAFEAHNQFEEQVLKPILRGLDAFGEVRIEHMFADHVDQHRALRHRLDGPTADLRAVLYELRGHLAGEERYLVSRQVLRDDLVTVESTG